MRLVPNMSPEKTLAAFKKFVKENTPKGITTETRLLSYTPGVVVNPDHPAIHVAAHFGIDQLGVDPDLVARAPDASFENVRNTQRLSNFADVVRFPLVLHHRRARNHFQIANLRQVGEHVVLNPVREKGILFVGAQVFKGQDRDRFVDLVG